MSAELSTWPKRPDGSNMTMGEMTPEQRAEQSAIAMKRIKVELESPAMVAAIARATDQGEMK